MKSRSLYGTLFCMAAMMATVSCSKSEMPEQVQAQTPAPAETGLTRVCITAGIEQHSGSVTKTALSPSNSVVWSEGDSFALVSEKEDLPILDYAALQAMEVGATRDIILVNPSNNGCFVGYNGSSETLSQETLPSLSNAGTAITAEQAESNLSAIRGMAANLVSSQTFVLVVEKVSETAVTIRSREYGAGIHVTGTAQNDTPSWDSAPSELTFADASSNGGTSNTVTGRPEQLWLMSGSSYLRGGGASQGLHMYGSSNGWTNWLMFDISGSAVPEFALQSGAGQDSAVFSGELPSDFANKTYIAVYPFCNSASLNGMTVSFPIYQNQTYAAGSIGQNANPSVGIFDPDTKSASFRNVCGVLRLYIKGTARVLSITVADNDPSARLWGTASVSLESSVPVTTLSGGGNSVILNCGGVQLDPDSATPFYIVVPAGSFASGFTATVRTLDGNVVFGTSKNNAIRRSVIKEMPENTLGEASPVDIEEYTILNPLMQEYMSNASYSYLGSQESYFTRNSNEFWNRTRATMSSYSPDEPLGVTVNLGRVGQSSVRLQLALDEDFVNVRRDTVLNHGEAEFELVNLIPGRTYSYRVFSGTSTDGDLLASGGFRVNGQLRPIRIDGGWNCRDLGGWTGLGGHKVQYEKLYRGGSLTSITDKARSELQTVGIRAELDFRGLYFGSGNYEGLWATNGSVHDHAIGYTPIYGADWIHIMSDYEQNLPLTHSVQVSQLAWVIKELRDGKPVYFHCKSGADRTGEFAFTVESILGLAEGDIVKDYELTSFSTEPNNSNLRDIKSGGFFGPFYQAVQSMTTSASDVTFNSIRDRSYYYLNRYFVDNPVHAGDSRIGLNASDIDWFVAEMLGISESEAASYRPAWARDDYTWSLDDLVGASHPSKCSSH